MTVWIVEENAEKHWLFMGAFSSVANANAYTAKRAEEQEDGACPVVDASGDPVSTSIGNGSECTIKLGVEKFVSKKYGVITRSIMESVRVDKLVVYDPEKKQEEAQSATIERSSTPATPRP